jgi:hypothetical protein
MQLVLMRPLAALLQMKLISMAAPPQRLISLVHMGRLEHLAGLVVEVTQVEWGALPLTQHPRAYLELVVPMLVVMEALP